LTCEQVDVVKKIHTEESLLKIVSDELKNVFSSLGLAKISVSEAFPDFVSLKSDFYTAMIGLEGANNGLICLHVSEQLAKRLCETVLETPMATFNDICDLLGEIVNIIGGAYKLGIAYEGYESRLSIPSVMYGRWYNCHAEGLGKTISQSFEVENDWMQVDVILD
jgi:CheY-specific phosphatase CheX